MTEEKNEAQAPKDAEPKKEAETPKAPQPENKVDAATVSKEQPSAPENPKGASAGTEKAPAEKVKPANCVQCNKSIKKIRWYYRDGKHYCTKRCWTTAKKSKDQKPAEGDAAAAKQ